jgi:hypothetical protein
MPSISTNDFDESLDFSTSVDFQFHHQQHAQINELFPMMNLSDFHEKENIIFSQLWANKILIFIYSSVFLVGLVGNFIVIYFVLVYKRMQTMTNKFITNLALADLLVIFICIPVTVSHLVFNQWMLGKYMCRFSSFAQGVAVCVSVMTLTAISIDRYYIINKPMKARSNCTNGKIRFVVICIWIGSFIIMSPLLMVFTYEEQEIVIKNFGFSRTFQTCIENWPFFEVKLAYEIFLIFVLFIFPILFMSYAYIAISKILWFVETKSVNKYHADESNYNSKYEQSQQKPQQLSAQPSMNSSSIGVNEQNSQTKRLRSQNPVSTKTKCLNPKTSQKLNEFSVKYNQNVVQIKDLVKTDLIGNQSSLCFFERTKKLDSFKLKKFNHMLNRKQQSNELELSLKKDKEMCARENKRDAESNCRDESLVKDYKNVADSYIDASSADHHQIDLPFRSRQTRHRMQREKIKKNQQKSGDWCCLSKLFNKSTEKKKAKKLKYETSSKTVALNSLAHQLSIYKDVDLRKTKQLSEEHSKINSQAMNSKHVCSKHITNNTKNNLRSSTKSTNLLRYRKNEIAIHKLISSRRRVVKLLITLVCLFCISWLPYHLTTLSIDLFLFWEAKTKQKPSDLSLSSILTRNVYPFTLCLALINSATNPLCYMTLSHGFRSLFKISFRRCCVF